MHGVAVNNNNRGKATGHRKISDNYGLTVFPIFLAIVVIFYEDTNFRLFVRNRLLTP